MPDFKDVQENTKIIFEDDDWLIVEPINGYSYEYYAPPPMKSKWNEFREGDVFFTIDKNNNSSLGVRTYTVFKNINGELFYYHWNGGKFGKSDFFAELPNDVKSELEPIIGYSPIYELLVKVKNGERVSYNEMERADDLIWKFNYNEKNPGKSMVKLKFDDIEDYLKLFDIDEYDIYFVESVYSYYGNNFIDYDHGYNEWNEGYLLYQFSDNNITKLKEILRLISPSTAKLETDEEREESSKILEGMFSREVEDIITDWTDEENRCKSNGAKEWIESDTCDYFSNYGLIRQSCFSEYYTTVSILLSLYNNVGDKTLSLREVLKNIGHRDSNIGGWDENRWDISCNDFDDKSFNESVENQLDKIFEKIEDSDGFADVYEYSNIFNRITKNYHFNNRYETKSGREFFIRKIDPTTNKIVVQVVKKDGSRLEDRSYTEEEFNNFLVSPELFEGFIRIN